MDEVEGDGRYKSEDEIGVRRVDVSGTNSAPNSELRDETPASTSFRAFLLGKHSYAVFEKETGTVIAIQRLTRLALPNIVLSLSLFVPFRPFPFPFPFPSPRHLVHTGLF